MVVAGIMVAMVVVAEAVVVAIHDGLLVVLHGTVRVFELARPEVMDNLVLLVPVISRSRVGLRAVLLYSMAIEPSWRAASWRVTSTTVVASLVSALTLVCQGTGGTSIEWALVPLTCTTTIALIGREQTCRSRVNNHAIAEPTDLDIPTCWIESIDLITLTILSGGGKGSSLEIISSPSASYFV